MLDQHVLIIEDDPAWQEILGEIIDDAGLKPVVAATRRDALAALAGQSFCLAVVDISLSLPHHDNRDGLAALRRMIELPARLPAIVVTGYPTVELAVETLVELNAVHFFCKSDFNRRDFIRAVKQHAGRPAEHLSTTAEVIGLLTDREREVLTLLIQGQTNKEMAAALHVTVNTIKKHVQSIFTKFNVENRAAAVGRALGREEELN